MPKMSSKSCPLKKGSWSSKNCLCNLGSWLGASIMKRLTKFRQFNNISSKYICVVVTTLLFFLLSGMHTTGLFAAHAASPRSTLHIRQNTAPNDNNGTLQWKYQTGG